MVTTCRDAIRRICPPWLQRGTAGAILYALALVFDALLDMAAGAVKHRFPGYYSDESLPLLGRDRKISRGRVEPPATYAARLARWWTDHAGRGGPYAMLRQLHAHYAPDGFRIDLVYRSGKRFVMAADGVITRDTIAWNPGDVPPEQFAVWWLVFRWPTSIATDGLWGDPGTWGDSEHVWGAELPVVEAADLRLVPAEWNSARCLGRLIILSPNADLWGYPDGLWGEPPDAVWGSSDAPVRMVV